jgi:hypothetical protein
MRIAWIGVVAVLASAPAMGHAAPPPPSAALRDADPDAIAPSRRTLISGVVLGTVGTMSSVVGFTTLGVLHAGDPGLEIDVDPASDPAEQQRLVRRTRAMEGLAYAGVALMVTGAIMTAVAATRLHRARRVAVTPLSVSARF